MQDTDEHSSNLCKVACALAAAHIFYPLYVGCLPTRIAKSSVLHLPPLSPLPPVPPQAMNKERQLDFLLLYAFHNCVNLFQTHPPETTPRQWPGPVPTEGNLSNPVDQYPTPNIPYQNWKDKLILKEPFC